MAFKTASGPYLFDKRDLIIRHVIIFILALFFSLLGKLSDPIGEILLNLFSKFVMISIIWNGNILFINILDKQINIEEHLRSKLLISGTISILWPIIVHYFFNLVLFPIFYGRPCDLSSKESISYLIMSVVITLFVNSIFVGNSFFKSWKRALEEKEELKRDSISAEFETLKNQINPHFLFNSLNTLASLIEENPQTATRFVQKLSNVYRYVLTQKDKQTVLLSEELQFIESYVYLNQIRFGENLRVTIHIEPEQQSKHIATLSLQMLLENAIKHNSISSKHPLFIEIKANDRYVIVKNNLQRKVSVDSNGIGLNNIVHRYSFLSELPVEIGETAQHFEVKIPLI